MAAPRSANEVNNPRGRGDRGVKKTNAESGSAIARFFGKFRPRRRLDEKVASIPFTDDRIYDFTVEEVITLLPVDDAQKQEITQEFTTANRPIQGYLIKQIEKRFTQFVEEYVKFRFDQLLIEKIMHGRKIDNVQLAAEEMTLKDFESVLDDGISYIEMIQPFLRRHEKSKTEQIQDDLHEIQEALLADLERERKTNHEGANKMAEKIPFSEAVKAAKFFILASIVRAVSKGTIDLVQFLTMIRSANNKIIGAEWRYEESESIETFSLYADDKLVYAGDTQNFEASEFFQDYVYSIDHSWRANNLVNEMKDSIVKLTNPPIPSFEALQRGASIPAPYKGDFTDTEVYEIWEKYT